MKTVAPALLAAILGATATETGQAQPPGPPLFAPPATQPTNPPGSTPAGGVPFAEPGQLSSARIEGLEKIAQIGAEPVYAFEVLVGVDEAMAEVRDKIPAQELERQKRQVMQQRLKSLVETKLVFNEARRKIPTENWPNVDKSMREEFEKTKLPELLKGAKLETAEEFDQKLRKLGSSLEQERRQFVEKTLAQQWVRQQIKFDEEVTHDQLVSAYRRDLAKYEYSAQARWEQISVEISKYPSKAEAYSKIAALGNEVIQGKPFAEVAKAGSDGATAAQGGARDWTKKGSLVSEAINRALFELPVNTLSPIIEDGGAFHILRVVERKEAGRVPFEEAQVDIKKQIKRDRVNKQVADYMAKLREQTPVWTVFDNQIAERPGPAPR